MEEKRRVLFVCVQNSFRSQMAEAIMNNKYGDRFGAESAASNIHHQPNRKRSGL